MSKRRNRVVQTLHSILRQKESVEGCLQSKTLQTSLERVLQLNSSFLVFILLIALLQGTIYLVLVPPWQHYDEPGHFEYAWLIAAHGSLFNHGDVNPAMRREVVASMLQHHFFWNLPQPQEGWWFYYTQLRHPPLYYALVSLPLRFVFGFDITFQLYIARFVSLVMFIITIWAAAGLVGELTAPKHMLRWAMPIALALLPPFVDVMTAVNNDVGAVMFSSLFLWGATRTMVHGLNWQRSLSMIATSLLAIATKTVAAFTVVLIPLICVIAFWMQQKWRWRRLIVVLSVAGVLIISASIGWGDSAYWYRWLGAETQAANTQTTHTAAPFGPHVLMLEGGPGIRERRLIQPLFGADAVRLAGHRVTIGGWVWANRPARIPALGLAYSSEAGAAYQPIGPVLDVATTPTFMAWTFDVPAHTTALHVVFSLAPPAMEQSALHVLLDGVVLAEGDYPPDVAPQFDDIGLHTGVWGGQRFTNRVRNANAEQQWLRFRPWLSQTLFQQFDIGWGRTPSLMLATFLDHERTRDLLVDYAGLQPIDGLFLNYAWGQIHLSHALWVYGVRGLMMFSIVGSLLWFFQSSSQSGIKPALMVFALAMLIGWISAYTRVLPKISEGVVYTSARYTFPVIVPTMLMIVAGWRSFWFRQLRDYATIVLICGMIILNGAAIWTIWSFYQALP